MPSQKEKDVLERQKQLAAAMAAKRLPSQTAGSLSSSPSSSFKTNAARSADSDSTPLTIKAGGLTFSKNPALLHQQHARPVDRRKVAPVPSSVIDFSEYRTKEQPLSTKGTSSSSDDKKVLGIHKSYKRPSPAAAMAMARAKAKLAEEANVKEPPSKKSKPTEKEAGKANRTNNRLKSLMQNVVSKKDDPLDTAAFAVNITPEDFWKNIRSWDIVTDLAKQQLEESNNGNKNSERIQDLRRPVPDTFINTRHYMAIWSPLCLDECRSQLLSETLTECGQMSPRNSPFLLVDVDTTWKTGNRHDRHIHSAITEIADACQVMIKTKNRGDGSKMQFFPHDICCLVALDKKDLVENLLRGRQRFNNNGNLSSFDQEAYHRACVVGHTQSHRNCVDGLILKVSKRRWAQIGAKEMYFLRIGSNVTALREYTALCNVDLNPLSKFLLGKHLEESKDYSYAKKSLQSKKHIDISDPNHKSELLKKMGGVEALGIGFTQYIQKKFNPSQLMAISASSQGYGDGGFTLIKGPPGTGKTTTLVNILNALHIRQFNKYYDEVRKIVALQTGSRSAALETARVHKPRLLVCAPSNAAVDNVILKIMEDGFIDGSGQRYNPSMIRVGVGQSRAVKDVALETKVDQILSENTDAGELERSISGFRMELQRITTDIVKCRKRIHAIANASSWPLSRDWEIRVDEATFDDTGRVYFVNHKEKMTTYDCPPPPEPGETQYASHSMPEYRAFMSRTVKLVESYFNIKSNLEQAILIKGSMGNGASDFEVRQGLEMHVLNSVHIVMTTLGTSGSRSLNEGIDKFEVVVVDEAAQSVEPATLSALQLGSRHCVMVGDPQQLPATIFNVSGKTTKYDRSLFQRLEEAGEEVHMLNEQYRMHPKISHFPRHIFYKGALLDGPNVQSRSYGNPLLQMITSQIPVFQPFTVLDLDSKEERGGTSLSNSAEAHLAMHLYMSLKQLTNDYVAQDRVAVITPYAQQAGLLRRCFGDVLGKEFAKLIEVNTVDAFQGREAKIVIFSAVRAAGSHGVGFLSDVRRMNVALTRAKHFLFVIARCKSIVVNPYWKDLVDHARDTNAVVYVPILGRFNEKTTFPPIRDWKLEGGASMLPSVPSNFSNGICGSNIHNPVGPFPPLQHSVQPANHDDYSSSIMQRCFSRPSTSPLLHNGLPTPHYSGPTGLLIQPPPPPPASSRASFRPVPPPPHLSQQKPTDPRSQHKATQKLPPADPRKR
ncbi:DNA helicase [Nitzschia inconspicua]|uniref:DNA helicase n=1 Tax=Nitzschia inconspicua TaxID=303405 RepID=A0A9K3M5G1_9STRA|nr:DNA helicase [Nitzschia inconspicua]